MIRLHLRQNPAEEIDALLYKILNPTRADIDAIDAAVRAGFAENFAREGSAGGPWAQLARSTQIQRAAQGYGAAHAILVRSGDYRGDFVATSGQHSVEFERTATGWRVVVGSDDRRVPWLEGGTATIPARPVTLLDAQATARIGLALDVIFRAV